MFCLWSSLFSSELVGRSQSQIQRIRSIYFQLIWHFLYFFTYYCDVCGEKCTSRRKFLAHHVLHMNEEHPCTKCDKKYTSAQGLQDHLTKVHRQQSTCQYCADTFVHTSSLRKHVNAKHEVNIFSCKHCNKTLAREN